MDGAERWQRRETALWRIVLDDVVVLAEGERDVFALAGGAELWRRLERPRTLQELQAPPELMESLALRGAVEPVP